VSFPGLLSGSGHGPVAALPDGSIAFVPNPLGPDADIWITTPTGPTCRLDAPLERVVDLAADRQGRLIAFTGDEVVRIEQDGGLTTIGKVDVCGPDALPDCAAACLCYEDISVTASGAVLIALGGAGRNRVVELTPGGGQRTVAGTGIAGFSGDGGPATKAQLNGPTGVAATTDGGFLISDSYNNRIRKIDRDGRITTVAGTGEPGLSGDGGPAIDARLSTFKIAAGPHGGYVIGGRYLRRVTRGGIIRTVAGDRGPSSLSQPDRTTDRLLGNGGSAHEAYVDVIDLAITPDDDYLVSGFRLRMFAPRNTRRLALAIRATAGSRRRVSFAITRPADVRLEVRAGGRVWTTKRSAPAGLGYFRIPKQFAPGAYQVLITARSEDGQMAMREDAIVLGRHLSRRLALVAARSFYGIAPFFTPEGVNYAGTQRTGLSRTPEELRSRCHRFGRLRIDCRFASPPEWGGTCPVNARALLEPGRGQLIVGAYRCGPFHRHAKPITGREPSELNLLLGAPWLMDR
jgi:hypothetical protein